MSDEWPKGAPKPAPDDVVAVLMTETMARNFERRCLGHHTVVGETELAGPLFFGEGDLPTYIIGVTDRAALASSVMRTHSQPLTGGGKDDE